MRNTEYQFVSTDADSIIAEMVGIYEELTGKTVLPASPEKIFIQWVANVIIQERVITNYIGNQNLPSRASGEYLDALSELFFGLERPQATPAHATVKFNISAAQSTSVLIPKGTRVTDPSQKLFWKTTEDVYIAIGSTSANATVECLTSGAAGNGYEAGQINTIVDPFLYFSSCANTTTSAGGSDAASDDEYYELLRQSMDSLTTAGPIGSYVYHAKKVSTSIADVVAVMPKETVEKTIDIYTKSGSKFAFLGGEFLNISTLKIYPHGSTTAAVINTDYSVSYSDGILLISIISGGTLASATQIDIEVESEKSGHVYLYVLMEDGTLASTEIKNAVLASCNAADTRPLTDKVSCHDALLSTYNINFTYYVPSDTTKSQAEMAADINKAVDDYVAWQNAKFGRDINPDKLREFLYKTGIKRAVINSPAFTALSKGTSGDVPQVASLGTKTIVNGGYEDE